MPAEKSGPRHAATADDSLRPWLWGGLLILALLAVNLGLTLRNIQKLNEDAKWVDHTHEVITKLERALSLVEDAETGVRGFLISDAPSYLEPYDAAVKSIDSEIDELQRLTTDNPRQQAQFPTLRQRLSASLALLANQITTRRDQGFEAARGLIVNDQNQAAMASLRRVIGEMTQHERDLLAERSRRSEQTYRTALVTSLVSGLAAFATVGGFLVLLRRHLVLRNEVTAVVAEQAERLQTTLSSIGDAVITTDAMGHVTNLNPVAEALTGWLNFEASGQSLERVFDIVNETTRLPVENPAIRALREGLIVGLANHTILLAKDGVEHPIDDSAAPIRSKDGEIVGCVLVFRDITERKRTERELAEASRRKDEFLAMLAHELRNPLAPIRNIIGLFQHIEPDRNTLQEWCGTIERQVAHMVRLIDDLLDVSRITRDKIVLQRSTHKLQNVVDQAIETVRPLMTERHHEFQVQLPEQALFVGADSVRLTQVFTNLLSNACKFTAAGGAVSLAVEQQGSNVVITVADTGIGMAPETLPRVFEMFAQVEDVLERSEGGLGIGLTLVQRLVELHGGTVRASSAGLGLGSKFVVELPILVDAPKPAALTNGDSAQLIPRRRILVVDDNRDAAMSLAMVLKLSGHETKTAFDGLEALRSADSVQPEVVFLDIGLPGLNGYDVARRMRETDWGRRAVLVAMTGWGQEEDRKQAFAAGFDHHLVKPADHSAITQLLREMP